MTYDTLDTDADGTPDVLGEATTVTGAWTHSAPLTVADDLRDNTGTLIWDGAANHIPAARLDTDTLTVAGNTVALGGTTAIAHGDLSDAPVEAHHNRITFTDSGAEPLTQPTELSFRGGLNLVDNGDGTGYMLVEFGVGEDLPFWTDAASATADDHNAALTFRDIGTAAHINAGRNAATGSAWYVANVDTGQDLLRVTDAGDVEVLNGDLAVGGTVDGVDVSAHAANAAAHHTRFSEATGDRLSDIPVRPHSDLTNIGAEQHHPRIQVSDGGAAVMTQPTDIDFGTNLTVADDGDGTVTISAAGGSTSTTHSVSDDGVQVLADPSDVDFGANLAVTDNGDGTVTVAASGGSTTSAHSVSDDGAEVLAEPTDVDFGTDLAVTDNGDGTVTVDATGSSTDTRVETRDAGTTLYTDTTALNFDSTTDLTVTDEGAGTVTIGATGSGGTTEGDQNERDVIDVDDYGADDTGGTASDTAFSNAVAAADTGDIILFKDGTYLLENNHVISKAVTLLGVNVTLTRTTGPSSWTEDAMFTFQGAGPTGGSTALTADLQRGSTLVNVNDATIFSEDDFVAIHDNATAFQTLYTARNTFARVTGVDTTNNTISLSQDAKWDHLTANGATAYRMEFLDGPRIAGFDMQGDGTDTSSWVKLTYCRNFHVEDVDIDGFIFNGISPVSSWKGTIENCTIRNAYSQGGSEGEAFQAFKSQDIRLIEPETYNVRRGTDMTKQCSDMYIYDPIIHTQNMGITMHNGEGGRNLKVFGGEVNQNGTAGGCLIAEDGGDLDVFGTDLFFSDRAINIDGGEVYGRGVTIRPSSSAAGSTSEVVQMYGGEFDMEVEYYAEGHHVAQLFEVYPVNEPIDKFRLDIRGDIGAVNRGVWLDIRGNDISNVHITGDVTADGTGTYFVHVDTAAGSTLTNATVANLRLDNFGGEGVRTSGDGGIDGLTVRNCEMDTLGDICVRLGGDSAYDVIRRIRIQENNLTTTSWAGEIYCAEPDVDYLWVTDNKGAVTLTGSETNVTQHGNMA